MSVKSVSYNNSAIIHSDSLKAMVTKWKVGTLGFRRTYHIVVLKGSIYGGLVKSTSAYVTDKIPKKQDLSASTFHVDTDKNEDLLKDAKGTVICSYNQKDKVYLGFKIEDAAFEKVESISAELIKSLGDFLKTYLETTASTSSAASSPKTAEKKDKAKAPKAAKAPETEETKETPKPSEPSKGFIRSSLSSLYSRVSPLVTCNRVGFVACAAAVTAFQFLYLNADIDPATLTSL
ncbi:MAG: hypothetical protein K940chlam5_01057 [Candidatus Anoxychlamydiales bacterium]|nr:hypothetical protein [Candidatus Anoxychlamydiales bacterium]